MTPIEELVSKRWIIKEKDASLYYKIKDSLKGSKKFLQDKLGYHVIVNPHFIKLEKIPGKAEGWMGIKDFQSILEYRMFCCVLMFLEDKELEEQFILSTLTEYVQVQFPEHEIDWTIFTLRKQFVRVVKYCVQVGILKQYDGNEDHFTKDYHVEVLYENTGLSRYYMRNFTTDIMEYKKPDDFFQSDWYSMDEDRGVIRRQRIYRRLLLSPGVYKSEDKDDDFLYIRNYRNQIEADFQSQFACSLQVHSSSAYLILEDDCQLGNIFPQSKARHDLILIVHKSVRERVKNYQYKVANNESLQLNKDDFIKLVQRCIKQNIQCLPKLYQLKEEITLANEVFQSMLLLGFLSEQEDKVILHPIVAKITGAYTMRED